MRIIYLHQYFNTPSMPGFGTRSYEMARRFVQWGHEVEMISSVREGEEANGKGWYTTEEEGIRVHWIPVPYSNAMSYHKRLIAFWRFAWRSCRRVPAFKGDVIFATSTPLTIAIPAIYAAWRMNAPMVFEVRDLWPEAPIQLGVLKNPMVKWLARKLEMAAYKRASHIVALTPGMKEGVVKSGIAENRISVIPNSCDLDMFSPDIDGTEFRRKLGLEGKFVFLYFGTHGEANGLGFVLEAAAELKRRGEDQIVFVLHGRGMERSRLINRSNEEGLTNVVFSEPLPEKRAVPGLVAAADVCMTIYKNLPVLYTCSPNKMFDSFAAGKPVLTNMPGWLRGLVEDNRAGVYVKPDDPKDFADKAIYLKNNPSLCSEFGRNARRIAENRFARNKLAMELVEILNKVAIKGRCEKDDKLFAGERLGKGDV